MRFALGTYDSFNLVIEVLLVSSIFHRVRRRLYGQRFNLVIEVLLVSSSLNIDNDAATRSVLFQSRNRGSFGFKENGVKNVGNEVAVSIS